MLQKAIVVFFICMMVPVCSSYSQTILSTKTGIKKTVGWSKKENVIPIKTDTTDTIKRVRIKAN